MNCISVADVTINVVAAVAMLLFQKCLRSRKGSCTQLSNAHFFHAAQMQAGRATFAASGENLAWWRTTKDFLTMKHMKTTYA